MVLRIVQVTVKDALLTPYNRTEKQIERNFSPTFSYYRLAPINHTTSVACQNFHFKNSSTFTRDVWKYVCTFFLHATDPDTVETKKLTSTFNDDFYTHHLFLSSHVLTYRSSIRIRNLTTSSLQRYLHSIRLII
jgi:hypothetical protein